MSCQNGFFSLVFLLSVVPAFFPLSSFHFQADREKKKKKEEEEEGEYFLKFSFLKIKIFFRGFSKSRVPGLSVVPRSRSCVPVFPFPFSFPDTGIISSFFVRRGPVCRRLRRLCCCCSAVSVASAVVAAVVAPLLPLCLRCKYIFSPSSQSLLSFFLLFVLLKFYSSAGQSDFLLSFTLG